MKKSLNILIAQLNSISGNIEYNKNKVLDAIKKAKMQNSDLVVFPSQYLSASNIQDIFKRFPYVIEQIKSAIEEIKANSKDIAILIDYPQIENQKIINKTILIENGKSLEIAPINTLKFRENKIFLATIEDIKTNKFINCDLLLVKDISISRTGREFERNNLLKNYAKANSTNLIWLNYIGAEGEFVYDGSSRMYNQKGDIIACLKSFEEDLSLVNSIEGGKINPLISSNEKSNKFSLDYEFDLERTYKALVLAISDYFSKNGFKKAVLGLSGGLDSTICAVLCADALGAENVYGISMPSYLTSSTSKNDAKELSQNLGINFFEVPIGEMKEVINSNLEKPFSNVKLKNNCPSYTQDNIQARLRANILWAFSNEFERVLVIATSDKSETYMGYATINGDMSGGYAPICDVTKTKLFALGHWINQNRTPKNVIPESILKKSPSAELALNPQTGKALLAEEALMPYEFLDEVIWRIENLHQSINDMMKEKFKYENKNSIDEKQKKAWLKKFFTRMQNAIYKWYISAPSPIIDAYSINRKEYNLPIMTKIDYER
ncbi:NAD(+) synthase [bacterium]|nr:NAD(+) synthase [bacterium]